MCCADRPRRRWEQTPAGHVVWLWLVGYAAVLLNRGEAERERESVVEEEPSRRSFWQAHMHVEHGVYLGMKATAGEYIIGTLAGIHKTRTLARKQGP